MNRIMVNPKAVKVNYTEITTYNDFLHGRKPMMRSGVFLESEIILPGHRILNVETVLNDDEVRQFDALIDAIADRIEAELGR